MVAHLLRSTLSATTKAMLFQLTLCYNQASRQQATQ